MLVIVKKIQASFIIPYIIHDFPARLRKPQDGLFTGRIDALDSVNHTYRVTFDRPALSTHSIPDIEVLVSSKTLN